MMVRRLFLSGFAAALLAAFGCTSDVDPVEFHCRDGGPAAANTVSLICGDTYNDESERVDVVLGGPESGETTLSGLIFDVTYDPAKLEFVPAASYTSQLFPDAPFVAVVLFNGQPGRVVASIQNREGALVTAGTGQNRALSLSFRRVTGIKFDPRPLTFENAEASNATPEIAFASELALSFQ